MIDTLLLDVDGVLVFSEPGFAETMDREYAWRDGAGAFIHEVTHHPAEAASLVGDGDLLTLIEELLPAHVTGLTGAEFLHRWMTTGMTVNRDLLALLPRTPFTRVFLATNQESRRGAYIHELFVAEPWHSGSLISYQLGYGKPDPAYFTTALTRIGSTAEECVFVDDKAVNVSAAAACGITAIHYTDLGEFAARLSALGLLASEPPH